MENCGEIFLKILLAVVNVMFFLAGGAILGVGIWLRSDSTLAEFKGSQSLEDFQSSLYAGAYVLIAFGTFTFLVGFSGYCGALFENKCLIGVYISLVAVILAAEVAGSVSVYMERETLEKTFRSTAYEYLHYHYEEVTDQTSADKAWNFVMFKFKCCGINNYTDFRSPSAFRNSSSNPIPLVCCTEPKSDSSDEINPIDKDKCYEAARNGTSTGSADPAPLYLNAAGCYTKVSEWVVTYSAALIGAACGVAVFEVIVIVAASIFCHQLKNQSY